MLEWMRWRHPFVHTRSGHPKQEMSVEKSQYDAYLDDNVGFRSKERKTMQYQISKLANLNAANDMTNSMCNGRIDGVLRDIAATV